MNLLKAIQSVLRKQRVSRKASHRKLAFESCEPRMMLTTYVVDWDNGSDDNPCTAEEPCKSYLPFVTTYGQSDPNIGKLKLQGGDVVELRPGVYLAAYLHPDAGYRGFHLRNVHGQPGNEIVIRGEAGAVLDAIAPDGTEVTKLSIQDASYVRIEGLEVTGHGDGILVTSSSHITITDNWVHDAYGESTTLVAGIDVEHSSDISIHDNLIHDNYDRAKPAFNSFNVELNANTGQVDFYNNVVFNTDANIDGGTGPAVKHSGEGLLNIHHNVISNAANAGIAADTERALVHHNLVLNSFPIRVFPNYTAREEILDVAIFNNSIIDRTPGDDVGGGLYLHLDQQANPGTISFDRNLVVDLEPNRQTRGIVNVEPYGSDQAYAQWIPSGRFSADENIYYSPSHELLFDVFSAKTRGDEGELYQFDDWQSLGYDVNGQITDPRYDDVYLPQNAAAIGTGWYADEGPRLTVLVVGENLLKEGEETRIAVVRSGDGLNLSQPLTVALHASDPSEISLPQSVQFQPGQAKVYVTLRGTQDRVSDAIRATKISASANGFTNNVSDWVRVVDAPYTPNPDPDPNPAPGYDDGVLTLPGQPHEKVRLHFDWVQRLAEYNNELGVVIADAADGSIAGIAPGVPNYAQAVLQSPSRQTIFASGAGAGDSTDVVASGGDTLVFYLVQNASTDDWVRNNPANDLSEKPVVFFSTLAGNPDGFDHVRVTEGQDGTIRLAWEDLVRGGDFSFTDAVIDVSISTESTGGYTDGVLTLPGSATDSVNLRFDWIQRLAEYDNELGVVVADAADGTVDGINPSDNGYAQVVLRSPSRRTIFASGAGVGDSADLVFSGGDSLVFYLVQNATMEDWLRINPTNDVGRKPVVFFSTLNANPDSFDHVRVDEKSDGAVEFAWEDLVNGGDFSFTDAVIDIHWDTTTAIVSGSSVGNETEYRDSNEQTDVGLDSMSPTITHTPRHNVVSPLDVNADGLVSPLDALLIINELLRELTGASAAISNEALLYADTNDDLRITPLDVLLVINYLDARTDEPAEGEQSVRPASTTAMAANISPMVRSIRRAEHDCALIDVVNEENELWFNLPRRHRSNEEARVFD